MEAGVSQKAEAAVEAARAVADWLKTNGQHKRAEDVLRVCRQNSSYRETCRRLHQDNEELRKART